MSFNYLCVGNLQYPSLKKEKILVLVVGPTAVGKTNLCINLAQKYDAEIFSCDSRQFYKELSIGTAKPSKNELSKVKHHFINNLSIQNGYSVADYEKQVIDALGVYFQEKNVAIMTGGSGLFVKAITHGFDAIPDVPTSLREELNKRIENGRFDELVKELKELDPLYCQNADLSNKQRVSRALEVALHTGKPFSEWLKDEPKKRSFKIIKIGLERPREELYKRINFRVDLMLAEGLIDEVKHVIDFKTANALQTVGYKEVFDYLNEETDYKTMVELIKRNTRRYAKRQLTWFKNKDHFQWFLPENIPLIDSYIAQCINF
jgi:tRNA dimethylallyltransferase